VKETTTEDDLSEPAEDQEGFGEADLGAAQADEPARDPEMIEGADSGAPAAGEATDVPALEPDPVAADVAAEEEAAAAEAGAIGGEAGEPGTDEAMQPVEEAGGGEAEGFEQAEEQLIESASHGDPAGHPLGDRYPAEESNPEDHTIYGEADEAESAETVDESE
jgi:hypothetical protein